MNLEKHVLFHLQSNAEPRQDSPIGISVTFGSLWHRRWCPARRWNHAIHWPPPAP